MAATSPTRIDRELFASAKVAGDLHSRSAAQQVAHWARIGRELEASGSVSHREIAEVLGGNRDYDSLGAEEQAVVRGTWAERVRDGIAEVDLAGQFAARGRSWVELDADGAVVECNGGGTSDTTV